MNGRKPLKIQISRSNPSYGALLTLCCSGFQLEESIEFTGSEESFVKIDGRKYTNDASISRFIVRNSDMFANLLGNDLLEQAQVDAWVTAVEEILEFNLSEQELLSSVSAKLKNSTTMCLDRFTLADIMVWTVLAKNDSLHRNTPFTNFFRLILGHPCFEEAHRIVGKFEIPKPKIKDDGKKDNTTMRKGKQKIKDEGKFVELKGAEKGKVVVRFPPEASGYLHIGHAKAALLNQHYQQVFDGQLIMRFDDTNPAKENAHFEKVIKEDLKLLKIKPDKWSYSSDHFEILLQYCTQLLREGKAYVDDLDAETMRKEREERKESRNRNNSMEKNLKLWEEMQCGSTRGQECCVRLKIDMSNNNGALRDPTIYRCKIEEHIRTGNKYKVYPTYDFACPVIDSIEGVTHALRTTEYTDRDDQYNFVCSALGLRLPRIWSFARLNMTHTVMSKRKLTWLVDEHYVDGWDDPRLPTVRGIMRHGLTVDGLKQFIVAQGGSRSVVTMEWDKIWAFNKKVIDPVAPRYTALAANNRLVNVRVLDSTIDHWKSVSLHPKNLDIGEKAVWYSKNILIEMADAKKMAVNDIVTFINWGNMKIIEINWNEANEIDLIKAKLDLDNKDYKKTLKVTWIAKSSTIPVKIVHYDPIISKAIIGKDEDWRKYVNPNSINYSDLVGEHALKDLHKGDIVQIQRKNYCICDCEYAEKSELSGVAIPLVLIVIPDGSKSTAKLTQTEISEGTTVKLLEFKKEFKEHFGIEYKSGFAVSSTESNVSSSAQNVNHTNGMDSPMSIYLQVDNQGNLVRSLKSQKAESDQVKEEIAKLLGLKKIYRETIGQDYIAGKPPNINCSVGGNADSEAIGFSAAEVKSQEELFIEIQQQGDLVRQLKTKNKNSKETTDAIARLLKMKERYKEITGSEYKLTEDNTKDKKEQQVEITAPHVITTNEQQFDAKSSSIFDNAQSLETKKFVIETSKEENCAEWYYQVITKADMVEYHDISGCYVLRPWSYSIWEFVKKWFDGEIKKFGIHNCYFPIFISQNALERKKSHISDFGVEIAWVTKAGNSELTEPIAVRPTSEIAIYPSYAKWVQSYRDLPIRLNQWCSVVRLESKYPIPFLRTCEFLWQEGHTAFQTAHEAEAEVFTILDLYETIYRDLLAIPVVKGRKSEKEKFDGSNFTTTVEAYVPVNGRGIQGATSHHLGQNFSKIFDISFEDPQTGTKSFAWQNSWGVTIRTIGATIMIHGDDKGLIVIIPLDFTSQSNKEEKEQIICTIKKVNSSLVEGGIRSECDFRSNYSTSWKVNYWELKGVPIRAEIGLKGIAENKVKCVVRHSDEKFFIKMDELDAKVKRLLETIHEQMYNKALNARTAHTKLTNDWEEFKNLLDEKFLLLSPFCGGIECEDAIEKESYKDEKTNLGAPMGAKTLCIPLEQPVHQFPEHCIRPDCGKAPRYFAIFGRSY